MHDDEAARRFVNRWSRSAGSERANAQPFFLELCDLLDVPRPDPAADASPDYRFEKAVEIHHPDGHVSQDRIDFYRRGCFVCEAKQALSQDSTEAGVRRGTAAWVALMQQAFGQALKYASYLPEGKPPFLLTCDVGHCFEVWSGFGGDYRGYGARRTIPLADLCDPTVRAFLRAVFLDPASLDPSRRAARVTAEVGRRLADLSVALEGGGHGPERVARFLMRCLFTMFAEDAGLLPPGLFTRAIREDWIPDPRTFAPGIAGLWTTMDHGGPFGTKFLRRFNGGLFRDVDAIPLTDGQLRLLLQAAECDWSDVEPAIFGTMVERALDPDERHALGAHFTPREYIERLVRPAVLDPLRAEWVVVQAEVRQWLDAGDREPTAADRRRAVAAMKAFHQRLCTVRVLDPACGTGNFLYVTLDLLRELEDEVLREIADAGDRQALLDMAGVQVHPSQFHGIEVNPRAREIAELVLWLGWLQGFRRRHPDDQPPEPILGTARSIECRDAVLAWDEVRPRLDAAGRPVSAWDQRTFRPHPVTGRPVPDDTARVPVTDLVNPRPAEWPAADFLVSNPPFLGGKDLRAVLGDGYAEALWRTYPEVGASADFVMYWWNRAARAVRDGGARRFGFITTNSITQVFDRRIVAAHLDAPDTPLAIPWAIADHPWVDAGADVRIAMTVGCRAADGDGGATLGAVTWEAPKRRDEFRARDTVVAYRKVPRIHADLTGGADATAVVALKANEGVCSPGVKLHGAGFLVTPEQAARLGLGTVPGLERHVRPYRNGRDLAASPRGVMVIDLDGLGIDEVRDRFPAVYQHVLEHVKPERDDNRREGYRDVWWVFGEPRAEMRRFLAGLPRYIATVETSKHRWFTFLPIDILPDNKLVAIGLSDAWALGVLSSRIHVAWALHAGGLLEDRPVYVKSRCFDPFPFPDATAAQQAVLRELGEALDAHRKAVLAAQPDLTMTGLYNALARSREALAGGPALSAKERDVHERALIGVLAELHDRLDAAVADAYGWPADLPDDAIVARLVDLNRARIAEEAAGHVRYLRPDFQRARAGLAPVQQALDGFGDRAAASGPAGTSAGIPAGTPGPVAPPRPWPSPRPAQIQAVRDAAVARSGTFDARELAAAFTGAPAATVRRHLETLEALGLLVGFDVPKGRRWSAAG